MPIVARPRMLIVLFALCCSGAALADEPAPKPKPTPTPDVSTVSNTVKLDLQISGVASGWKLEDQARPSRKPVQADHANA